MLKKITVVVATLIMLVIAAPATAETTMRWLPDIDGVTYFDEELETVVMCGYSIRFFAGQCWSVEEILNAKDMFEHTAKTAKPTVEWAETLRILDDIVGRVVEMERTGDILFCGIEMSTSTGRCWLIDHIVEAANFLKYREDPTQRVEVVPLTRDDVYPFAI